jgi:hypothetical protein
MVSSPGRCERASESLPRLARHGLGGTQRARWYELGVTSTLDRLLEAIPRLKRAAT